MFYLCNHRELYSQSNLKSSMRKIFYFTAIAMMMGYGAQAQIKYKTNLIQKLGTNKAENEQMEGKLVRLVYEKGANDDLVKLHWNYSVKNKTDKEIAAGKEVMQLIVHTKKGEQYTFLNNVPALPASSTQLGEQSGEIIKDEVTSYELEFKSLKAAKKEDKEGEKKGFPNPIKKVFKKKDKEA